MKQLSALIIDDCAVVREALADTLAFLGYETATAADGLEGVEAFARFRYDLVVTDVQMPKLDGHEVTRRVREAHPDVPIVVVSGIASEALDPSWPVHRLAVLPKPFGLDDLTAAIDQVMGEDAERLRAA